MNANTDIYVVVAENDQPQGITGTDKYFIDDDGPLVFEQYTRQADLESVKERAERLQKLYGKCRIARLVFLDQEP